MTIPGLEIERDRLVEEVWMILSNLEDDLQKFLGAAADCGHGLVFGGVDARPRIPDQERWERVK